MIDLSFSLVNQCIPIKKLEKGIPFDPYILLADKNSKKNLKAMISFLQKIGERRAASEYSLLSRLNCHKEKFDQLYKDGS